jgi:hypothetical protein
MIDLGEFETCVCTSRGIPNTLCDGNLSFEEKGKKVKITTRAGEEAKALAIDQCLCTDNETKCDGMFLYRRQNKHWMILIELKGREIDHAFEQLHYMRTNRPEYQQIETLFMTNQKGIPKHEAFVVSNYIVSGVDKQKLEERFGIRVKAILHSEATSPVPDVRRFLQ